MPSALSSLCPQKPALKKILIFSQKSPNSLETETRIKFLIFQETELSYTSGNGNFYF